MRAKARAPRCAQRRTISMRCSGRGGEVHTRVRNSKRKKRSPLTSSPLWSSGQGRCRGKLCQLAGGLAREDALDVHAPSGG